VSAVCSRSRLVNTLPVSSRLSDEVPETVAAAEASAVSEESDEAADRVSTRDWVVLLRDSAWAAVQPESAAPVPVSRAAANRRAIHFFISMTSFLI
jgi:hypothetical protein